MRAKLALAITALIPITTTIAQAQTKMVDTIAQRQPEMADSMRSDGKIYVVVAVLATIFAGIFAYLIYLDRKITKAENK